MIVGVDACNIRKGGGLIHLLNFLKYADFEKYDIDKIIIWSNDETLEQIADNPLIIKKSDRLLNKGFVNAFLFQIILLKFEIRKLKCDIMFVPGGTFLCNYKPFVTISQNLLPFEVKEAKRYSHFLFRFKLILLKWGQLYTFKRANAIIFLTNYSKDIVNKYLHTPVFKIIPHGIDLNSSKPPKVPLGLMKNEILNLLYVSIISPYKHHVPLIKAIINLNKKGLLINLTLIGPRDPFGIDKNFDKLIKENSEIIHYLGRVEHEKLFSYYHESDAFVFSSSCENLPIIMIEAMSSGLPIVSSNLGPMPEVLGENFNMYFNPLNIMEIEEKLSQFYLNPGLRYEMAKKSYENSLKFTWKEMSNKTLELIVETFEKSRNA